MLALRPLPVTQSTICSPWGVRCLTESRLLSSPPASSSPGIRGIVNPRFFFNMLTRKALSLIPHLKVGWGNVEGHSNSDCRQQASLGSLYPASRKRRGAQATGLDMVKCVVAGLCIRPRELLSQEVSYSNVMQVFV